MLNPITIVLSLLGKRTDRSDAPKPPSAKSTKVRLLAIIPVLVTITAFILSFLCVYAGHTPGMMEDYALFTLNTSRIGQNIRQEIDNKILNFDEEIASILPGRKRFAPVLVPAPKITATPTTLITLAPRGGIGDAFSSLTAKGGSEIDSAESAVHSKANSLDNEAHAKASSLKSAAEAQFTGAVGEVEEKLIHLVNRAFDEIISELELNDFYSVHVMTTCTGEYQFPNGTNVTVGDSGLPVEGTHKVVDKCSKHSAIDPLSFLNIFYWVAIVLVAVTLLMGFVGVWKASWKCALFNVIATVPAFFITGLSSALAHGVAVGVPRLIDFVGNGIGIDGVPGQKFLRLTWAVVILLFINMIMWSGLAFLAKRHSSKVEASSSKEAYEMDGPYRRRG